MPWLHRRCFPLSTWSERRRRTHDPLQLKQVLAKVGQGIQSFSRVARKHRHLIGRTVSLKTLRSVTGYSKSPLLPCLIAMLGVATGAQSLTPVLTPTLLTPAWVELGENATTIARIVVNQPRDCPVIQIDGVRHAMRVRRPLPAGLRPVCEFKIPAATRTAAVKGQTLILPGPNPTRVIVLGDTGCRIKGKVIQDCNDPNKWPFAQIAAQAASEKPELIIHVGDYLYRESPCPPASQVFCGGTPIGDNWEAWNADFFAPAAKLLAAAPWAVSRGNHEDCQRAWRGWFYYLDPRPWNGSCREYSNPYLIKLAKFELVMLDTSAVREFETDDRQVSIYAKQLASLRPENAWLVDHHPFWGFATILRGIRPLPLTAPLEAAWVRASPTGYTLILSGHVHLFEFVSLDGGYPPQLVAGDGGTEMAIPIEIPMNGTQIQGASVRESQSERQFGYTSLTKNGEGWRLELKNRRKEVLVSCSTSGSSAECQGGTKN